MISGISLQRLHHGLHEESHEAQLHAVLFLECLFVLRPQSHDLMQVDLVEGREHDSRILRFLESPRDREPQSCERHALFVHLSACPSRCAHVTRGSWRLRLRLRFRRRHLRGSPCRKLDDVTFG